MAQSMLRQLIDYGYLIGVEIGAEDECVCCGQDWGGLGLCDVFSKNSPAGSDCNRAERWLLRPRDSLMTEWLYDLIHDETEAELETKDLVSPQKS